MSLFFNKQAFIEQNRKSSAKLSAPIHHTTFSPDANLLVTASSPSTILVHQLSTESFKNPFQIFFHNVLSTFYINSIDTTNSYLYIGTNQGLWRYPWNKMNQDHDMNSFQLLQDKQISTISSVPDLSAVVAADMDANIYLITDQNPKVTKLVITSSIYSIINCMNIVTNNLNLILAGCDDGKLYFLDIHRNDNPIRQITLPPNPLSSNSLSKVSITALSINNDNTFAMIADTTRRVSSIHIPTAEIVASSDLDFIPRALVYSKDTFYCGGSDHYQNSSTITQSSSTQDESVLTTPSSPTIPFFTTTATPIGFAHVSFTSVYAMSISSKTNMLAVAGYNPCPQLYVHTQPKCLADIYKYPPVRSFSVLVP